MSSSNDPLSGTSLSPMNVSYTALVATLVLLLAVSSAIVVRSLILRRRHQRLVEEAIRTGTWLPNHFSSTRRRRDVGQKPTLWEAWLNPNDDVSDPEKAKKNWDDIMPVYAAYVDAPAPPPQGSTASSTEDPENVAPRPSRFVLPFARRRSPPSSQASAVLPIVASRAPSLTTSSPTPSHAPAVRVAVLIAMPKASHKHHGDENGPPVVEIGLVDVDVKEHDQEMEAPSHDAS